MPKIIMTWILGDREQSTISGLTISARPLYHRREGEREATRVGSINPDYAEILMEALSSR